MRRILIVTLTACAFGLAGQASAAAPERMEVAKLVTVEGVDFRDVAQVEAIYARLQRAALQVCMSPDLSFADRATRAADRACSQRALSTSVAALNRPLLTARYQQHDAPILASGY